MVKRTLITAGIIATLITSPVQAASHTRTTAGTFTSPYIIRTIDGHKWKVTKPSRPGKKVIVKFNTRGTAKKTDDIIIRVRKAK